MWQYFDYRISILGMFKQNKDEVLTVLSATEIGSPNEKIDLESFILFFYTSNILLMKAFTVEYAKKLLLF